MPSEEEQQKLRQYLLGEADEESCRLIERRLLTDDDWYEELQIAEDELIEEYVGGELDEHERRQFVEIFLAAPERQRKVRLARALGKYAAAEAAKGPLTVEPLPARRRVLFTRQFKLAIAALLLIAACFGVWRAFFHRSEIDEGLAALHAAYGTQRPLDARISEFPYAPAPHERGEPLQRDSVSHDLAASLLSRAARNHQSARASHALGELYLSERKFDQAVEQFEKALSLDENNARLHNDLGAALLEQGKLDQSGSDDAKAAREFAASLAHFERALALDPNLLEALFNRALCYESLVLPRQARDDWRAYLEKDSQSAWADEARRNLKRVEQQIDEAKTPDGAQLLQDYLRAYREHDDERVWQIVSRNREAITGRLVSSQLVAAYLDSASRNQTDEAREHLRALAHAGDLELKRTGDRYTSEVARVYERTAPNRLMSLGRAWESMRSGFDLCLQSKFKEALEVFKQAKEGFAIAGDEPEGFFADYWLSYCLHQTAHEAESLALIQRLESDCERRDYKWLLSQSLNHAGNLLTVANEYTKGTDDTKRSLKISEELGDSYMVQKNLGQLAIEYTSPGDYDRALQYLGECLAQSATTSSGTRQTWRNYATASRIFSALGEQPAAAAYAREALRLAVEEIKDPSVVYLAYIDLGTIYAKMRDFNEAIKQARLGLAVARQITDERAGQKCVAYATLQLANLYRQSGQFDEAVQSYDQAISIYDRLDFEIFGYEAHKGKLLTHIARGDDAAATEETRAVLDLIARDRKTITEESARNKFANAEQGVYDAIIDFDHSRLGDDRAAFDHSESSRARTLLDLVKGTPQLKGGRDDLDSDVASVSQSLSVKQIQERMPDETQLLQYAVLSDKILIWYVTRARIEVKETRIAQNDLNEIVKKFELLVSNPSSDSEELRATAKKLYELLIAPAEPLLDRHKQLCVVPDKILNHIAFAALIVPGTERYLIEDYTLISAPSASVFINSTEIAREKAGDGSSRFEETVLSVGNPTFDHRAFPDLPDLPAAARESAEVAKLYASRCLIGRDAAKERVVRELAGADIAHFASHYVLDARSAMLSKLLLAKARQQADAHGVGDDSDALSVYDLYRMKLPKMRLVVLSACRTGAGHDYEGEGVVGIARAFIAAGVPLVVASRWGVDSDAAEELMVNFHTHRKRERCTTADALARAQRDMLTDREGHQSHPYYWAPFVVLGGYSKF
jgi:CHAT domain-containing protein/lipoprotein NlpI